MLFCQLLMTSAERNIRKEKKRMKERRKEGWKGRGRGREGREGRELPIVDVSDRILEDLL